MNLLHASWRELDPDLQQSLRGKLSGLYNFEASDAEVFDWLAPDKQQAIQLLVARFEKANLWRFVLRVTNVYGIGGTGFEFTANNNLITELRRRPDFTSRFACHNNAESGFYERRRTRLALHLLLMNRAEGAWSAHFDSHSPVASPASLLRHLWHERALRTTPTARQVAAIINLEN